MTEPQEPQSGSSASTWLRSRYVVAAIIAALALVFIFENTRHVKIRVIGPVVTAPLWEALLATFLAGALTWFLVQRRRRKDG